MKYFQNTIINFKIAVAAKIVIFIIAMHKFIDRNREHENAEKIENVNRNVNNSKQNKTVVRFNSNKIVVIIKTIKYCNYCKKLYHIDNECKELHFEFQFRIINEIKSENAFETKIKRSSHSNLTKTMTFQNSSILFA